jgi:hypothetical protein
VSVFGEQQHFAYVDVAGTVWDAWYDGSSDSWSLQQINAGGLTNGPAAVGRLFVSVFGKQQHFAYVDLAGTLQDVWYDGETNHWSVQQINAGGLTNGPAAVSGPFLSVFGEQQHFAYLDNAGAVWDSWYDRENDTWALQKANVGGQTDGNASADRPFVWINNQQQHFTYVDAAGTIFDAWYDRPNDMWKLQQINAGGLTNGPAAVARPVLSVFGHQDEQQHVGYLDSGGIIWDMWYDGGSGDWKLQQINASGLTEGPAAVAGPFIYTFLTSWQQHFAYLDSAGTIWDSWYDGKKETWNLQQINAGGLTEGPAAAAFLFISPLKLGELEQHFVYVDSEGTIWDSWYDVENDNWNLQQINGGGLTDGPPAVVVPFSADSMGLPREGHVPYRDSAGIIWDSWYDVENDNWNLQQINAGGLTNGPPAVVGPFVSKMHFIYLDAAGLIWDSSYDGLNNVWNLQQINAGGVTTAPEAACLPFVFLFPEPTSEQMHVAYLDAAGTIWDSWYDVDSDRWNVQRINTGGLTDGPPGVGGLSGGAVAKSTDILGHAHFQQHFIYRDMAGDIWDSWYQG